MKKAIALYFCFLIICVHADDSCSIFWGLAAGVAGACVTVAAAPAVLTAAGFTAGGVAAGSLAASAMSMAGNVAAGSTIAALQSAGAAGLGTVGTGVLASAGGTVAYKLVSDCNGDCNKDKN